MALTEKEKDQYPFAIRSIPDEVIKRFKVQCALTGKTQAELFTELVMAATTDLDKIMPLKSVMEEKAEGQHG